MNNYEILLVEDKLVCQDLFNNRIIKGKDAIDFLQSIDSNTNNKIYLQGINVIIKNANRGYSVKINNFVNFYMSNYKDLIYFTVDTMKKNEEKMQKAKHKGKDLKKGIIAKVGMSVAPIVMVSMLASGLGKKDVNYVDNNKVNFEKIEKNIGTSVYQDINTIIKGNNNIKENVVVDDITQQANIHAERFKEAIRENTKPVAMLNIDDRSTEDDIIEIQNEYRDICERAGQRWGISPNVLLGLLTQESHGKEVNLTQIEFDAWKDQILKVYNYDDNAWMKVVFTDTPDKFKDIDMIITKNDINNKETNVKCAAMILNYIANLRKSKNIMAVLEEYNKGAGNFKKNLAAMEASTNKTADEVLSNPAETEFLNYSYICNAGDDNYVCNVAQYIPNKDNGGIYHYYVDETGPKLVEININNSYEKEFVKNTR